MTATGPGGSEEQDPGGSQEQDSGGSQEQDSGGSKEQDPPYRSHSSGTALRSLGDRFGSDVSRRCATARQHI